MPKDKQLVHLCSYYVLQFVHYSVKLSQVTVKFFYSFFARDVYNVIYISISPLLLHIYTRDYF